MNKKRVAAIDLGTYNCRLVIAEVENNSLNIIHTVSKPLFLGKNLVYRGEFDSSVISKTVIFFQKMAKIIKEYDIETYRCVATEACRKSINADLLVKEIKSKSGLEVEIISAEEEAKLCLKSCSKKYLRKNQYSLVFDIGGGSTELILFNKLDSLDKFKYISLPYGVLNLEEYIALLSEKKVVESIDRELKYFHYKYFSRVNEFNAIGCCMTATSLANIHQKKDYYEKKLVNEIEIDYKSLKRTSEKYFNMSVEEKKKMPNIGEKFKLLDNGNFILGRIYNIFFFKNISFSDNGLRRSILNQFLTS